MLGCCYIYQWKYLFDNIGCSAFPVHCFDHLYDLLDEWVVNGRPEERLELETPSTKSCPQSTSHKRFNFPVHGISAESEGSLLCLYCTGNAPCSCCSVRDQLVAQVNFRLLRSTPRFISWSFFSSNQPPLSFRQSSKAQSWKSLCVKVHLGIAFRIPIFQGLTPI